MGFVKRQQLLKYLMWVQVTSLEVKTATHQRITSRYCSYITDGYTARRKAKRKPPLQHSLVTAMNMAFSQVKDSESKIILHSDLRMGSTREERMIMRGRRGRRLVTWNVRTLLKRGKLDILKKEMVWMNIGTLGVSEIR